MDDTTEQLFELVSSQLIPTQRESYPGLRRSIESGQLVKIARGWYLPREAIEQWTHPWEKHAVVMVARIVVTARLFPQILSFTADSALLILGLAQYRASSDVHARIDQTFPRFRLAFPAIQMNGRVIAQAGKLRLRREQPTPRSTEVLMGLRVADMPFLVADVARGSDPVKALAEVSVLMHEVVKYIPRDDPQVAIRSEAFRKECFMAVSDAPRCANNLRARHIITAADPRCESIAEGAFLAFLYQQGCKPWEQQLEIRTSAGRFFADFAIPEVKLIIEIEGYSKHVTNGGSAQKGHQAFVDRASQLLHAGWRPIALTAREVLFQPDSVASKLRAHIPEAFIPHYSCPWWLRSE